MTTTTETPRTIPADEPMGDEAFADVSARWAKAMDDAVIAFVEANAYEHAVEAMSTVGEDSALTQVRYAAQVAAERATAAGQFAQLMTGTYIGAVAGRVRAEVVEVIEVIVTD